MVHHNNEPDEIEIYHIIQLLIKIIILMRNITFFEY